MDAEAERIIRELQERIRKLESAPLPAKTRVSTTHELEEPEFVVVKMGGEVYAASDYGPGDN